MKLQIFATALLAAFPGVVSTKKLRGLAQCTDDQIPCDISSDAACRRARDLTSRKCKKTWSKGCCTRDCQPDGNGGRICRISPPIDEEEYDNYFGLVLSEDTSNEVELVESDADDEDEKTAASEDMPDATVNGEDVQDNMFYYYDDNDYGTDDRYYSNNYDDQYYGVNSNNRSCNSRRGQRQRRQDCCRRQFDTCKRNKRNGRNTGNCQRTYQRCSRNSVLDVA